MGKRLWFEEVPEEEQYWFLAPWGTPPSLEAKREAEREKSGLTPQDAADLRDIEHDIRHASVFGTSERKARETRQEVDELRRRQQPVKYGAGALEAPWWLDVYSWEHAEGDGREQLVAPIIYTRKEQAEEEERRLESEEPEGYMELVERFGQADTDAAFDNYVPLRAL